MKWGDRVPTAASLGTTLAITALLPLVLACAAPLFPDRPPVLEGEVVGMTSAFPFDGERTIWVKETPSSPCGIVFRVEPPTRIVARLSDDTVEDRRFEELKLGDRLRVWSGAVAESCPMQATADVIEVLFSGSPG